MVVHFDYAPLANGAVMRPLGFVRVAPAADALSTAGDEGFANASLAAVCPRGESRGKRRPCNQDRGRSYSSDRRRRRLSCRRVAAAVVANNLIRPARPMAAPLLQPLV